MSRRKFLRYTRAQSLDQEDIQHYLLSFPPATLYHRTKSLPHLSSPELFANLHPLELEIGCGSAEFLCSLAEKSPDRNFVGIDISGRSLLKGVEIATALDLDNIKFINADFHLLSPLLQPLSLQAIYLHFPDPHRKPGHQKRRIFSPAFLDQAFRVLQPYGLLSVMTDVEDFFGEMLHLLEEDRRFAKAHPQRYLLGFEPAVKSHFQRIWEQHGEQVYRFEARKQHT